jgi:hypothetical protein
VSAKDEYEQLCNSSKEAKIFERKEKISSVFMTFVLIDVEKKVLVLLLVLFMMEGDTFSFFVGGLVLHRSLDFSRGISLYVFKRCFTCPERQKACCI